MCAHTFLTGSRYSLIQTDGPHPTYLVIDHAYDDAPAPHPATLPSTAPAHASSASLALRYLVGSL